ncbi:MAG: cobyric acid synthase CobQ, partial [Niameybacter sp.]
MHKPRAMFQGTASSVGKSVLVAGLCRIFYEDGYRVAPFKSQNMSLNSYITEDGKEMGRAQVMQAEAAGIKPHVLMNPILIKPTGDMKAQYIIEGEVFKDMTAMAYQQFKPELKSRLKVLYEKLEEDYDVVV